MLLPTKDVLWSNLLRLLHNQHTDRLQPDRLAETNQRLCRQARITFIGSSSAQQEDHHRDLARSRR